MNVIKLKKKIREWYYTNFKMENRMRQSRSMAGNLILVLFLVLVGGVFFFPVLFMITKSLKPMNELYVFPPRIFVDNPTLDNYADLFDVLANTTVPFMRYFFNSMVVVVIGSAGYIAISSMCAFPLAKFNFPGRNFISRVIVYSLMFNATVTAVPTFITVSNLGLIDSLGAIIYPSFASTLGLYLMQNFMQNVPDSLVEAAKIDGASYMRIHWGIIMPVIKPAWITAFILVFQNLWNNAGGQYIYDEKLKNVANLISQISAGGVTGIGVARAGVLSAASVVMFLVPLSIFLIMQSNVISTMASSGMKE